jgi:integrase/recombinase XerD
VVSAFAAERAISPTHGSTAYVVVDQNFGIHRESTEFLAWLRRLDRSPNTERIYAGRVARYLIYCQENRLKWNAVTIDDLGRFLHSLAEEPIPTRRRTDDGAPGKPRSRGTANAIMTSVCEFMRFAATRGWVDAELAKDLTHPKYLRGRPEGFDWGEEERFRIIRARSIRFRDILSAPEYFDSDQVSTVMAAVRGIRDALLCTVLLESGVRVGEALGLRREDMHLLTSSTSLGCATKGPHLHVRRRMNANGALGKSRLHRAIPVSGDLAKIYAEYQDERSRVRGADDSDFVFVNLKRAPIGSPLKYPNVKKSFERFERQVGFAVRPHMFRHTAATRWLESGIPRDVVQALLGHVASPRC